MDDYTFECPPNTGEKPRVILEICKNSQFFGKLEIELFREVFPLAVENIVHICKGDTYRIEEKGFPPYTYKKVIQRTYEGCKIYDVNFNNTITLGDIYNNDGTNGATIYSDMLIPKYCHDYFYPHSEKGLVSVKPIYDPNTETYWFDSNFDITLSPPTADNTVNSLDEDQIVVGRVLYGIGVLDEINRLISPFSGRKYPKFTVSKCYLSKKFLPDRRRFHISNNITKYHKNTPKLL
jgi:cyclophilin family peptidyl-prolyl cis-trans isomerase